MKTIFFTSLAVLCCSYSIAQLQVDTSLTPQQIVEDVFLSNGIFVANVTYNGVAAADASSYVGTFSGTNNSGLNSGIIMGSGFATGAIGPNNNGSTTNSEFVAYDGTDADLMAIVSEEFGSGAINDWAIIEFDFIATGDSLSFDYVFGSEEYPEYTNTGFNDAFGFFVSGPGIVGSYSNNAVNIALVPGTNLPVTVNNLNNGYDGISGPCENCEYYVHNGNGSESPYNSDSTYIQCDGFSTVMTASIGQLVIGETYHIKLAICDVLDAAFDSYVFLDGGGFAEFCTEEAEFLPGECLLSTLDAQVHYTEDCGVVQLFNYSEINIETTGCHYDMGDGGTTDACTQGITYEYAEPGTYTIKLVYMVDEFTANFEVASLLISDTPPVQPVITVTGDQLSVSNWDGTSTLQWYLDGTAIVGATSANLDANYDGYYTVTANNGCPISSEAAYVQSVSNVLLPSLLSIFPNPAVNEFQMNFGTGVASFRIADAAGRLVQQATVTTGTQRLSLQPGAYLVQAMSADGSILATQSLIVN
ncbi:MAG: T9SS type A sorting domain-containing protein [Flavobacteriales bacterium]|nr:T9SS type A sorting domain-containing protein [Flavobacteriales bacterium]